MLEKAVKRVPVWEATDRIGACSEKLNAAITGPVVHHRYQAWNADVVRVLYNKYVVQLCEKQYVATATRL